MIKLIVYLISSTVLHKNRKIMQDKSNCGVSKKKMPLVKSMVVCLTVEYFLFLDHLTRLTMMQLYYNIVSVDIQMK